MGKALEVIAGGATAPGATFTALTMGAGNSLTIRNFKTGTTAYIVGLWDSRNAAGNLRIRSPRLHDNVQGIRVYGNAGEQFNYIPQGLVQKVEAQDTLIAEITGSAVAAEIEQGAMLLYYENLDGVNARFINSNELRMRSKNIVIVENSLATGVAGGWSGEEALNAEFNLLKANTDYALVGATVSANCLAVGWRGADSGNMRFAIPGEAGNKEYTANFFIRLSDSLGVPLIPVINSANLGNTLVDCMQNQAGVDVIVSTILVELS